MGVPQGGGGRDRRHALIDIKTTLGTQRRHGRIDSITNIAVYQLVGYMLLDCDDHYGIDEVGVYSSRYGSLITWPAEEMLELLAGKRVHLGSERQDMLMLLTD